jgi:ribonuclease P protein component
MQRGPLAGLKYIVNNRRTTYRVAVVVSRKVSKSAVVRNRIRRRVYELIRTHNAAITRPYDLVFIVYAEQLAVMSAPELEEAIVQQLARAQVLSETTK